MTKRAGDARNNTSLHHLFASGIAAPVVLKITSNGSLSQ